MSPREKNISADELAKQGGQARKEKKRIKKAVNEKAKKHRITHRQQTDQKRVFLHITRWADWKMFSKWFIFFQLICVLPILVLPLFFPDTILIDLTFITFLSICSILFCLVLYFIANQQIRKKVLTEKDWIENLSFKLIAYPDILVYRSYPAIYLTIEFERKTPKLPYLLDILATLPYEVKSKVEFEKQQESTDEDLSLASILKARDYKDYPANEAEIEVIPDNAINVVYKFEMTNKKASKFNRHRRWARKWIHQACDVQLQAIHEKYPVKTVILNNGTKELDFDWWIPYKGKR